VSFYQSTHGWYRKKEDWQLKKERYQTRPGRRRMKMGVIFLFPLVYILGQRVLSNGTNIVCLCVCVCLCDLFNKIVFLNVVRGDEEDNQK